MTSNDLGQLNLNINNANLNKSLNNELSILLLNLKWWPFGKLENGDIMWNADTLQQKVTKWWLQRRRSYLSKVKTLSGNIRKEFEIRVLHKTLIEVSIEVFLGILGKFTILAIFVDFWNFHRDKTQFKMDFGTL